MPIRLSSICFVATSLAAAGSGAAAAADDPDVLHGVYGQVAGGGNYTRDQDFSGANGSVGFDDGGLGIVGVGYAFGNGWRPELEFAFRKNDQNAANGGNEEARAAMANLWYDAHMPSFAPTFVRRLRPFIGAGIGDADVRLDQIANGSGAAISDSDNVFAWQAGAGFGYDVTRRLALSVGYRYLETDKATVSTPAVTTNGPLGPTTTPAGTTETRYRSDGVLAGLSYAFGRSHPEPLAAAASAPVAAEPQAEAAAFETVVLRPVNFQSNRADLTQPSRDTLDEIAQRLSAHKDMKVLIEGYTDATGSEQYNRQLGRQRAEAVRDYLVSRGVDAGSLEVASRGPANPVADNRTAEGRARNRRAEVNSEAQPANVKIVIEGPTQASVDAAHAGGSGR